MVLQFYFFLNQVLCKTGRTSSKPPFIKTEVVLILKFRPKLNRTPRQHQSHYATSPIINFFNLKKIFFKKRKEKIIKILGWLATPLQMANSMTTPNFLIFFLLFVFKKYIIFYFGNKKI